MDTRRYQPSTMFFTAILLSGYIIFLTLAIRQTGNLFGGTLSAEKGILDLRDINFSSREMFRIEGQSEFYWKQLLTPRHFASLHPPKRTGYANLPGIWNGTVTDSGKIGSFGYATYRLLIKLPEDGRYGLRIKEIDCAYRLWANGEEVSVGTVASTKERMKPSWRREELYFFSKDRQVELVMQVSNFHHRKGGPEDIILIGTAKQIIKYKRQQTAFTYFLAGVFVIMALHFMGIFLFRKTSINALNFSLLCFAVLLRLITTNEKIILELFPAIPWGVLIRLEYLSYMAILPLFYGFFRSLYPSLFPLVLQKALTIVTLLTSLLVIATPPSFFTYTPLFFQVFFLLMALYTLIMLTNATLQKLDDSIMVLRGFIFVFLVALNDCMYYNRWIDTDYYLPIGLFIMIFTQSFVVSRKISAAYLSLEVQTKELEAHNINLENTVQTRTAENIALSHDKEELQCALFACTQQKSLLAAHKEQMRHMLANDIYAQLKTVVGLAEMPDIPTKELLMAEAGRQMLCQVGNMLDVERFEQTPPELVRQDIALAQSVEKAVSGNRFWASQTSKEIAVIVDKAITVNCQADLLERVVSNLIMNAINYSPANSTITVQTSAVNKEWIELSVIDQGPGIKPELHEKIFDRYCPQSKLPDQSTFTGLALAFCKLVVEAHGGKISIDPSQKKGTKVTFTLPVSHHKDIADKQFEVPN